MDVWCNFTPRRCAKSFHKDDVNISSDRGSQFTSSLWNDLAHRLGVKLHHTLARGNPSTRHHFVRMCTSSNFWLDSPIRCSWPACVTIDDCQKIHETGRERQRSNDVNVYVWKSFRRYGELFKWRLCVFVNFWTLAVMTLFYPTTDLFSHPMPYEFLWYQFHCGFNTRMCESVNNVKYWTSEIRRNNWAWGTCWNVTYEFRPLITYFCVDNFQRGYSCFVGCVTSRLADCALAISV